MNAILKECVKHGSLTIENVYYDKNKDKYFCRHCLRQYEKNRPKRKYEGHFADYHREYARKWRQENSDYVNSKIREDRSVNPDKYREREREQRALNIERYRLLDRLQKRKINETDYLNLMTSCNGVCSICKKDETRISKNGNEICSLIIDHCHECEDKGIIGISNVRGILCHACNMMIEKDVCALPPEAIEYLAKHQHKDATS